MDSRFDGWCMVPTTEAFFVRFIWVPVLFFAAFVWLGAELSYVGLRRLQRGRRSIGIAIATATLVYAAIGAAIGLNSPQLPEDISRGEDADAAAFTVFYSVFWPLGILADMDTFSDYSCGY